jgi:hypothetical protein
LLNLLSEIIMFWAMTNKIHVPTYM